MEEGGVLLAESSVSDFECAFVVKVCLLFGFSFQVTLVSQVLADVLSTDSLVITETSYFRNPTLSSRFDL